MEEIVWIKILGHGEFVFKCIEEGEAKFALFGEYYDKDGKPIKIENGTKTINIKSQEEITQNPQNQEENTDKKNANLKILRLNEEGISPSTFKKDVTKYYFIANENINSLDVTAIPENEKASVKITGNQNFVNGLNEIKIEVTSEDNTNKKMYIIYVTKTNNIESANANLENLALENVTLNPEFNADVTYYNAEVSKDIENINLIAVAESINAKVQIDKNDKLNVGKNNIKILVTAEDGYTTKEYNVEVYKRDEKEEEAYIKDQELQTRKLSTLLEENDTIENEKENEIIQNNEKTNKEKRVYNGIIILVIIIVIVFTLILWIRKKHKKNEDSI